MRHDEFVKEVQRRARLGSHKEAQETARATLQPLAEHLAGESRATSLPRSRRSSENTSVHRDESEGEAFSAEEFFKRGAA